MCLTRNKQYFFTAISCAIMSLFGCSEERFFHAKSPIVDEAHDDIVNKQREVKVNVLIKDEDKGLHQSATDVAPANRIELDVPMADLNSNSDEDAILNANMVADAIGPTPFFGPALSLIPVPIVVGNDDDHEQRNDTGKDAVNDDSNDDDGSVIDDDDLPVIDCGRCSQNFPTP